MTQPLEIVVAHYNEDLSWLFPWEQYVTVYHKGDQSTNYLPNRFNTWIHLPNVGREGHTYLHHMITNYDNLADVTIFLQGRIEDHPHLTIGEYIDGARKNGFSHMPCIRRNTWEDRIQHCFRWSTEYENKLLKPAACTLAEFWDALFGSPITGNGNDSECHCLRKNLILDYTQSRPLRWYRPTTRNIRPLCFQKNSKLYRRPCCRPQKLEIFWAGCFGVNKDRIHMHSTDFYSGILPYLDHDSNPEEGHYLERLWFSIFRARIKPETGQDSSSQSILDEIREKTLRFKSRYGNKSIDTRDDKLLLNQIELQISRLARLSYNAVGF